MSSEDFKEQIKAIINDPDTLMIHVSPDFQCDQTEGHPVSLCVCWENGKAWLAPNEFFDDDEQGLADAWQGCADFGIRDCFDEEDFNRILKQLGEDAYQSAYIPTEEGQEDPVMQF